MESFQKHSRQVMLPGFGREKQERLYQAKVLIIGAGGLGCPLMLYLAAAGIGTLAIADDDRIELSNLHRQILYNENDIGKLKAETAAEKIRLSYPECSVHVINEKVNRENVLELIEAYDIIVDGTDNLPTRYLINDACLQKKKPWIYGSVHRYQGQVAVFTHSSSSYRDIFPENNSQVSSNCNDGGVMGVLPGIIGTMQTNEVIKVITGIGTPAMNRLITFDALNNIFYETQVEAGQENNATTASESGSNTGIEKPIESDNSRAPYDAFPDLKLLSDEPSVVILDVREFNEEPQLLFPSVSIPLFYLPDRFEELKPYDHIHIVCHTEKRSLVAKKFLEDTFPLKKITFLKGGLASCNNETIKNGKNERQKIEHFH